MVAPGRTVTSTKDKKNQSLCGREAGQGRGRSLLYLGATSQNFCKILSKYPAAFGSLLYYVTMPWPVFVESLVDKVVLSLMYIVVSEYPVET